MYKNNNNDPRIMLNAYENEMYGESGILWVEKILGGCVCACVLFEVDAECDRPLGTGKNFVYF